MSKQRPPIPRDRGPLDSERDALLAAQVAAIIRHWTEGGGADPRDAEVI